MTLNASVFDDAALGGLRTWPRWGTTAILLFLLGMQAFIARTLYDVQPAYRDLPPAPSDVTMATQSAGDPQFLYRLYTLRLQHAGALDGRVLGYKDLHFARLETWFRQLDRLDRRADTVPTMAAFLFRHDKDAAAMRHMVAYLADHARTDAARKWRWLAQAVHLARYYAEDLDLALALAEELARLPVDLPYWARQMPVFVLQARGEQAAARALLQAILETDRNLPPSERRWIAFYMERYLTSDKIRRD